MKPHQPDPAPCGSEQGAGLDSGTTTGPALSLGEGSWGPDCGCGCKGLSCGGLCVYLGPHRSPAWGEISSPVLKVKDLQVKRLRWPGGRGQGGAGSWLPVNVA